MCLQNDPSYPSLGILALSQLVIGMTDSFMTPFYSKEAVQRGMSITEAGVVYSIMYLITMMCSPVFGKYIEMVGSRKMFLIGTMVAGLGYSCFGFLQWVVRKQMFFSFSLLLRMILSVAEAAHFTAITPLTIAAASEPSNDKLWVGNFYCFGKILASSFTFRQKAQGKSSGHHGLSIWLRHVGRSPHWWDPLQFWWVLFTICGHRKHHGNMFLHHNHNLQDQTEI